ncbi:MAG: helix-hairpin-helix domain-containing protein [Verrucomicrobia bacterium]|nr:helix-hairpin-helix domain-containing protein [Verrucomicrobiota bacterium]
MSPMNAPSASAQGSVLIVVMVVCLGLVSLALVFGNSMAMAYRGADNGLAGQQAEQAIEGGVRYAQYLMTQVIRPGAMPDPAEFQSEELLVGDATFWFIGEPESSDPIDQPSFGLADEASKLNLNTASSAMLQGLPGMTPDLAEAIVAWRKTVSTSGTIADTSAGTSADAMGGATFSSSVVKNAPFESVDELALLTGTDSSLLYGQDLNLNHAIDPNEADGGTSFSTDPDSRMDSGLFEYVTVFSREPNVATDGTGSRVNITQQPLPAKLTTLLTQTFDANRAAEIERKVRAAGKLTSVLGFYIHSGMTDEEFEKVAPNLTAKNGAYVNGLVNVNTASATVLACIPGIGIDKAASVIAARAEQAIPPTNLAWIVPILGEAGALAAGPYLTVNSYQWSADIAAVGRHGRGYRRTRFVIDNSTGTPRIIYRRNMAPLGWALGSEVREMLATKKEMK